MRRRRELSCSFCGKKESEIQKLVAGPRVTICDQCVALAQRIMENTPGGDVEASRTELSFWSRFIALVRKFIHGGGAARRAQIGAVAR